MLRLSRRTQECRTALSGKPQDGERVLGTEHPCNAFGLISLGTCYENTGQDELASQAWQRAIDILQRNPGNEEPLIDALALLAKLRIEMNELGKARGLLLEADELTDKHSVSSWHKANLLSAWADFFSREGHDRQAEIQCKQRIAILESLHPDSNDPGLLSALQQLARIYERKSI